MDTISQLQQDIERYGAMPSTTLVAPNTADTKPTYYARSWQKNNRARDYKRLTRSPRQLSMMIFFSYTCLPS
jgi:hypothetical protein